MRGLGHRLPLDGYQLEARRRTKYSSVLPMCLNEQSEASNPISYLRDRWHPISQ